MVQEDLGGFGDARLRRVGARLLEAMGEQPTTCVHALAKDRNEALCFGRFLDHSSVSHATGCGFLEPLEFGYEAQKWRISVPCRGFRRPDGKR
jgi:hypothetical protein